MKRLFIILLVLGVLTGCNQQTQVANEKLIAKIDSLEQVLDANAYTLGLLEQLGQYMDSIDSHRKWITLNLETGLSEVDYIERMKQLNQYFQKAEWTITELEKTRSAYASQVKRLKKEIGEKDQQIGALQLSVANFKEANASLQDELRISEQELIDTQSNLDVTQRALASSEMKAQNLIEDIRLTEAESLYAQAEGMEEVAKRTQLAPKRKKAALEKALSLYQSSSDKGYEPAAVKVEELKQRVK